MDKKYRRVTFMERLQDQMIETDWAEKVRTYDMNVSDDDLSVNTDSNENSNERNFQELMNMDVIPNPVEEKLPMASIQFKCNPVAIKFPSLIRHLITTHHHLLIIKLDQSLIAKNHVKFANLK